MDLNIPLKNWKKNRRKAAQKNLDKLLRRQNHVCHWCGRKIVRLKTIREKYKIVKQTATCITYVICNGKEIRNLIATVDHLIPLAVPHQDANRFKNIVASCFTCNQRHSQGVDMTNRKNQVRGGFEDAAEGDD